MLFIIACGLSATAQNNLNIVPAPANVKVNAGKFSLTSSTVLVIKNGVDDRAANFLNSSLKKKFGFSLKKVKTASANFIQLTTLQTLVPGKEGAYNLTASAKNITVNGQTASGTFYGVQTLLQLLPVEQQKSFHPVYAVPAVEINDAPRFAYRGMHLDVARHFMPVDFIKKYIDYLAACKYNTFHFHLTDDQGWRIEIKKYPQLTAVGGYRNGTIIGRYPGKGNDGMRYGGFYTQEQIKAIVQYAADRFIEVIPEIEMPGHASAAIAAYPQLSCFPGESTNVGNTPWAGTKEGKLVQQTWGVFEDVFAPTEYTFSFLQDVMNEVMPLFPSKYVHIGGDECPKESWKRSPFCQQLIKDNNLKDEHGLQSYFIQRIEKYINSKGKKIIGWDEILEGGLAPNATVMSWRGEEGGIEAAKQNHDVIMTPGSHCYLDHSQSKNEDSVTIGGYLPLEKVYSYEPIPDVLNAEQAKHILGAQGNVWTEYIGYPGKVEYMIFPRMMALSEVLWSPKAKRDWKDFERRLPSLFKRLEQEKINYSKAYYDLNATVIPAEDNGGVLWKIESKNPDDKIVYLTGTEGSRTNEYKGPVKPVLSGSECAAWIQSKNLTISGNVLKQKFLFTKATGKKITLVNPPSKSYPGDGAFTLVNGVQNEKGLSRSNEFLGFNGTDLDATIDLGKITDIKKITLHVLEQPGSWIYAPSKVEVQYLNALSTDEKPMLGKTILSMVEVPQGKGVDKIEIAGTQSCRYIRVIAKNYGTIPSGNPGAGNPAWLFADEIEVD